MSSSGCVTIPESVKFLEEDTFGWRERSEENRIIILAACVIGLPDRVIAERLHLVRRTLTYRKAKLLDELRRLLSDE